MINHYHQSFCQLAESLTASGFRKIVLVQLQWNYAQNFSVYFYLAPIIKLYVLIYLIRAHWE